MKASFSIGQRAIERVVQDVAQGQHALQLHLVVDDDEAMHAGFADRLEDGLQAVVGCAGVDAREVLYCEMCQP